MPRPVPHRHRIRPTRFFGQAGTTLAELRHRIPNLIAKEEVIEEIQSVDNVDKRSYRAFSSLMAPPSMGPSMGLEGSPSASNRTRVYGYRIAPRADSTFGDAFDEFRTDSHNHRIADATDDPHNPHTMGLATSWLIFLPKKQKESRFRYLGQQKIGSHQTYVLAFAQIPGVTHLDTVVGPANGRCATHVQGVVWIDQSTNRIVRIQIDLLSPAPGIQLNKLRSILNYGEVKIRQHNLPLWLPTHVETSCKSETRPATRLTDIQTTGSSKQPRPSSPRARTPRPDWLDSSA